jgi:hypothetical protein
MESQEARKTSDTLPVYIPDTTYGQEDDDYKTWQRQSRALKGELEREFQLPFEETDIGPGLSIPAFVTELHAWLGGLDDLVFLLLLGRHLSEGWEWWSRQYEKLKPFLRRRARFPREGAAVLAMKAVEQSLGNAQSSVRLIGYTPWNALDGEQDFDNAIGAKLKTRCRTYGSVSPLTFS